MIKLLCFPLRKLLGLVLRQARLHRKVRVRQIQSAFQVDDFGHKLASKADDPFALGAVADQIVTIRGK
jgi:hypothetical protein